jgi:pentatricopeptide repeat protein
VVCWNALLSACSRARQPERAAATFAAGVAEGLQPDSGTVTPLVAAWAAAGEPERALQAHTDALAAGVRPTARLTSAAVAACASAGDAAAAWRIYDHFRSTADAATPDAPLLTALIDACARGGDADGAWRAFAEGDAAGVPLSANEAAVCAMLGAFCRARQPDRAMRFFHTVRRAWPRQTPPTSAYLLLRDAAAASNDVALAKEVAAMMQADLPRAKGNKPGKPAEADATPARRRAGAAVARFEAEGREWETENGEAEAAPGGDADAARLLAGAGPELVGKLEQQTGYAADTSCVLLMAGGEAAQRAALACHAEKKALGALLLRQPPSADGAPARVRVSIRMCRDCHAAFAAASALFAREIACDDGHAHRFVDGVCSCGDRWR